MKKLIVANWKMNPSTRAKAAALFRAVLKMKHSKNVEVVICPPFVYLEDMSDLLKPQTSNLKPLLGAQDDFSGSGEGLALSGAEGPYTGEVSAKMLKDLGVRYVIVGHSERRGLLHETDDMIAQKVVATLRAGLHPILCVGEPRVVRAHGIKASQDFVKNQLKKDLSLLTSNLSPQTSHLIVAYEPIWAISTTPGARKDTPKDAAEMIMYIKKFLSSKPYALDPLVLYGGSVDAESASGFLERPEIDGALVGGASLDIQSFKKIINFQNT